MNQTVSPDADFAALHLVGGDLALDFVNTRSWRGTPREVDHLASAEALAVWCRRAGLIDTTQLTALLVDLQERPEFGTRVIEQARQLRDVVEGAAVAILQGSAPADRDMRVLTDLGRETLTGVVLRPGGPEPLGFDFSGADTVGRLLGPIAWSAVAFLSSDRLGRLKRCPPADCRWLFLDLTKNRSRRWCEMSTCGNREKTRRHRLRS